MAQYSNTCQSESKVIQVGPQICEIPRLILSRMSSPLMRIWLGVERACALSSAALPWLCILHHNLPTTSQEGIVGPPPAAACNLEKFIFSHFLYARPILHWALGPLLVFQVLAKLELFSGAAAFCWANLFEWRGFAFTGPAVLLLLSLPLWPSFHF